MLPLHPLHSIHPPHSRPHVPSAPQPPKPTPSATFSAEHRAGPTSPIARTLHPPIQPGTGPTVAPPRHLVSTSTLLGAECTSFLSKPSAKRSRTASPRSGGGSCASASGGPSSA